jgi:Tol biopolymer transport system component
MQIAVMDSYGKNIKKITTGSGAKLYPTFSRSGKNTRAPYMRKEGKTPAAQ